MMIKRTSRKSMLPRKSLPRPLTQPSPSKAWGEGFEALAASRKVAKPQVLLPCQMPGNLLNFSKFNSFDDALIQHSAGVRAAARRDDLAFEFEHQQHRRQRRNR